MDVIENLVKPYTILLVDDEDYILKFMSILLRAADYQVLTATDGVRALDIIRSGVVDLAVIDLIIPQLDGITLIKQVRFFSKLPIIVISAIDSKEERLIAFKSGADDYFTKPFDPKRLTDCISARLPTRR